MGFYLRKSVNVRPYRVSFSKSDFAVSTGIEGHWKNYFIV
jgi:hypothetical protein